jgi:hypothetical protein
MQGTTGSRPAPAWDRPRLRALLANQRLWLAVTIVVTAGLYISALQWGVSGSDHPYATDVGEIQNALPRWGTIHYPGYPLYSALGSLVVTLLRLLGIAPAAGSSLFSALWGVATVVVLFALARELGAGPAPAALGAIAAGLTTSMWVDSSLAEIHTMGAALTVAALLFALRFGRSGQARDLLWLGAAFSLGLAHQRNTLLLAPALVLLAWGRWAVVWRQLPRLLAIAAAALLTYLYLPLRAWQGARWTFGAVGTWQGFLQIFLDTKVERIVAQPADLAGWLARARVLAGLLHDDLWLPALALGLAGLWLVPVMRRGGPQSQATKGSRWQPWREAAALTLAWLAVVPLALVIWEGRVSDALLAVKLSLPLLAGVGLALAGQALARLDRRAGALAAVALAALVGAEAHAHRPAVLAVTRDPAAEEIIARVEQVAQPAGSPPATFMALWGNSYWALTYAQAYRGQLAGLNLVDHNADMAAVVARGERLLTLSETLYRLPLDWWEARLGRVHLASPAPGIVELRPQPAGPDSVPPGPGLDLENGLRILSAGLEATGDGAWVLTVHWLAERPPQADYAVAVHLLAQDPPQGAADVLAQADRQHPVDGWYPTSRWAAGEVVCDSYLISAPPGSRPVAVRIGMYQALPEGGFENSPWLTLALSEKGDAP